MNGVATLFVYDDWKAIAEFDEWDYFQAWNVYGPGPDEVLLRSNAQAKYGYIRFQQDRHEKVAFLLDNDGQVVEKYTYDVFGRAKVTDGHGQDERPFSHYGHWFLFQGRDYFHELEIYDYRNRFYHPTLGRFLQSVPKEFEAGDMNLFRYCGDDPIVQSDPLGLDYATIEEASFKARLLIQESFSDNTRLSQTIKVPGSSKPKTITYLPSEAVAVLRSGSRYDLVPHLLGKLEVTGYDSSTGAPIWHELEGAELTAAQKARLAAMIHGHENLSGKARAGNSKYDKNLYKSNVAMKRMDESDQTQGHRRRPTNGGRGYVDDHLLAARAGGRPGGSFGWAGVSARDDTPPSAAEVDDAHQATGVPSLGAEAVNAAPGPP